MTNDPQFGYIPLMATFLKHFNRSYLGPQPKVAATQDDVQVDGVSPLMEEPTSLPEGVKELIPEVVQEKMREMFVGYFNSASKTLVKGQVVRRFCSSQ